ncbi:MAG: RecX family transcriptional regulator [Clostridia bacterium]|nr:RecX family transcriptional regulator [Clostridia bacterium]
MRKSSEKKNRSKAAKGVSAYDEALRFLTPKARTVRETENHLDECDYAEMEIFDVIERLKANGLLNDEKYAADFIESRLNTKPVSRQKLREQLEGHFIKREVIEAALEAVTEETEKDNCRAIAEKFFRQFSSLELSERLRRVGLRLASRGYSFDDIKLCLEELTENMDEE